MQRLKLTTRLTIGVACGTVMLALGQGFASVSSRSAFHDQQIALQSGIDLLQVQSRSLHMRPQWAAGLLDALRRIEHALVPEPAKLLRLLADGLTAHPAIQVDGISWLGGVGANFHDSISLTVPQQLPLNMPISVHNSLSLDRAERPVVQLDLSGVITGVGRLRDAQMRFDVFVQYLQQLPDVQAVNILESPVHGATTGVTTGITTGATAGINTETVTATATTATGIATGIRSGIRRTSADHPDLMPDEQATQSAVNLGASRFRIQLRYQAK